MKNRKCFQLILALSIFILPGVAQAQCVPVTSVACNWTGDETLIQSVGYCTYPMYFSCNGSLLTSVTMGEGGCTSPSTPYLFVKTDDAYFIENNFDLLFSATHEQAKKIYEKGFDDSRFLKSQYLYKLKLSPSVAKEGVKLVIKEVEPEESYLDHAGLLRIIHPGGSDIIVDNEKQEVRSVKKELIDEMASCDYKDKDCQTILSRIDNNYIMGKKGDQLQANYDITNIRGKRIFLMINSWGHEAVKPQGPPLGVNSDHTCSFEITLVDVENTDISVKLNDVHPAAIQSDNYIDITDAVGKLKGNKLGVKISWTQNHDLEFMTLLTVEDTPFQTEELMLVKADHQKDGDVLSLLKERNYKYTHLVTGDKIDLVFEPPKAILKPGEKESFVFMSSGFYHPLRTDLYPNIDTSDNWKKEIKAYAEELRSFIERNKMAPLPDASYYERNRVKEK